MSDIVLRPMTADDFEAVLDLDNRANLHDGRPMVRTLEELQEEFDDLETVLATDVRVAELGGVVVGYASTLHLPSAERLERCYVDGRVAPEHRERGVGRALLAWGVERAEERLRSSDSDLPKVVRVQVPAQVEATQRLCARLGLTAVRWFDELLRPLTDLPDRPQIAGITISSWPDGRDDEIREVKNAAFADHWGSTPTSAEQWRQQIRGFGSRLDLSLVALDERGAVVACCLNSRYEADDDLLGRRDGWISTLGTLAPWRGRGVASALIVESLHRFAAEGLTHASIEVDADNPTGAARLYRSLGFEPAQRSITHERWVG